MHHEKNLMSIIKAFFNAGIGTMLLKMETFLNKKRQRLEQRRL
jgi:hypothetical protein